MAEDAGPASRSPGPADVAAVVVTYHPEPEATEALLRALAPQVGWVVVVDNGSPAPTVDRLRALADELGARLDPLGTNRGIAAAQNVGVAHARRTGARFVLLSDQDSLPAADMVERLLAGFLRAAAHGPVAAVGPVTVDERNGSAPLVFSDHRWGPRRAEASAARLVPVTFLLASGCLIETAALDVVGPMNDAWFIDHVDLEWGLRAHRAGFALYAVADARLAHSLGDRTQRVPGRSRDVHIHSPERNYYMARNTVLLMRSGLLPARWVWGYAFWITKYAVFYVLAVRPRLRRGLLLARGLRHGVAGRTGPLRRD